ncbi:hypothetical protein ACR03S_16365 (plasmid) [Limimaricola variabilis]
MLRIFSSSAANGRASRFKDRLIGRSLGVKGDFGAGTGDDGQWQGSLAGMACGLVFDVPVYIETLSSTGTLLPSNIIATGTLARRHWLLVAEIPEAKRRGGDFDHRARHANEPDRLSPA